jgi:hypothetical protein
VLGIYSIMHLMSSFRKLFAENEKLFQNTGKQRIIQFKTFQTNINTERPDGSKSSYNSEFLSSKYC